MGNINSTSQSLRSASASQPHYGDYLAQLALLEHERAYSSAPKAKAKSCGCGVAKLLKAGLQGLCQGLRQPRAPKRGSGSAPLSASQRGDANFRAFANLCRR